MNAHVNTAAHAEVLPSALGLSDAELDTVSGGDVNPGMVLASIFSLGIGCAVISAAVAITRNSCAESFNS